MLLTLRYPAGTIFAPKLIVPQGVLMGASDIPFLSVAELALMLKGRELSPIEATQAYIKRIEKIDPALNSYITVAADEAMKAATKAGSEITKGRYRGPLHGIPVAVKDQMWTKGIRTTNASTLLKNFVPDEDATVVTRLKNAGAILLGKLNMSEFASGGRFKYPYGIPRNPWNTDYETGSSSSGSGAATAAALCGTSLGEDTSGSIRHPSSWCGIVGLRPTWGRVSRYGLTPVIWSMDQAGPMSRTVEDCAITLGAICGYDPKDPYTYKEHVPDFRKHLIREIKGLKVGLVKELTYDDQVAPDVREAVLQASHILEELGADVDEVSIPLATSARIIFYTLMYVEQPAAYDKWIKESLQEFDYDAQVKFLSGSLLPAKYYSKAQRLRSLLRQQTIDALSRYDVLVSPTMRRPAPKIKPFVMPANKGEARDLLLRGPDQTPTVPLSNLPAISVPCGFSGEKSGGMPIGLQIIGHPFDEVAILNVAYLYEQNTPWHRKRPPI